MTTAIESKTKALIDDLKSVCANYGLGNDGNEFKVITQVFLYKYINDKFLSEIKRLDANAKKSEDCSQYLRDLKANDFEMISMQISESTARLKPNHLISSLYQRQNEPDFSSLFDSTLLDISKENSEVFSVVTNGGEKIVLFENISKYVTDNRDEFCKALINKVVQFSFEEMFEEKFDFYSTIFEYLIKDYNTNSGGKYAEYFTPHAVAKIMASCTVRDGASNVTCYDPSAGSGTLLMNLAHKIGEDKCTIYSQDISQKSSNLLRLNLILNNLVHSIHNIIKGNTILDPFHRSPDGTLMKFDYIVSNPPFKLDFSDYVSDLDTKENKDRFFAGLPNVPSKSKDKMAIYPLFIQHIMFSLSANGKAAIVVPTGFLTAQAGIEKRIREALVTRKMLKGVISMPSNIFATTGTNVSILFLDKANEAGEIVLMDASNLGTTVKEGKNQKTLLSRSEEQTIIETFNSQKSIEDLSTVVTYEKIKENNYSLGAGQYFDVKLNIVDIGPEEFERRISEYMKELDSYAKASSAVDKKIHDSLKRVYSV